MRSQQVSLPQGYSSSEQGGREVSEGLGIQLEQEEELTCPGRAHLQCLLPSEHRCLAKPPAKLGSLPAWFLTASITPSPGTADARPPVSSSSPRNTHCDGLEQVTMAMCALPWRQHFIPLPVLQNESLCWVPFIFPPLTSLLIFFFPFPVRLKRAETNRRHCSLRALRSGLGKVTLHAQACAWARSCSCGWW